MKIVNARKCLPDVMLGCFFFFLWFDFFDLHSTKRFFWREGTLPEKMCSSNYLHVSLYMEFSKLMIEVNGLANCVWKVTPR